jgi:hypothetical protein
MKLFFLSFVLFLSACTSYEITNTGRRLKTEDEYFQIVEKNSDESKKYNGLYNTIEMRATILNSEVIQAQLDQNTRMYLWDDNKYMEEKAKADSKLKSQTEVFVAFYTPERKNDDLNKNNSVWKVFLDTGGHRYDAKIVKIKALPSELQGMYPYYNKFFTPYAVTFPVPVTAVEAKASKLIVTGPVGSTVMNFAAGTP